MAVSLSALCAGHPLLLVIFVTLISLRGCVNLRDIVWLEGLNKLKIQMSSSGIENSSFCVVA
jgi:hypothetical protein